jgi:phosphoribosylformylglycinamidine cyclo-ligase
MIDGKSIRPGDAVIGIASSGLHTNGYSLARQIFFEKLKLKPKSYLPEFGTSVGEELLKVHISYGPVIQTILKGSANNSASGPQTLKGLAHITGGGFIDNIPRVLPHKCDVMIRKDSWELPPVFEIIRNKGGVPDAELYQVFNMGIGMVLILAPAQVKKVTTILKRAGHRSWVIGEVVPGSGRARVV